ncbi:MAG: hypothetical protein VX970_08835 [Planctomycetota bacterium]|nr:hypothetical protein [Planctomycetota bacterium]MEC8336588.1 hypothetical protein [Planctomycetota bacterium]
MIFFIAIALESFIGNHDGKTPCQPDTLPSEEASGEPDIRYGYRRNNRQNPANR